VCVCVCVRGVRFERNVKNCSQILVFYFICTKLFVVISLLC